MAKPLIEMVQERKKAVPSAIAVSFLIDLLKDILKEKLVEWGLERLGWSGRFLIDNPFAFLTITVVGIILWFAFLLAKEHLSPTRSSLILDKDENPIPARPGPVFTIIGISTCLLICATVGYGAYKFHLTEKASVTLRLTAPPGGWLPEWGQPIPPLGIRSIVDVSTLVPYRKPIPLMLVYMITDNTVDEQSETRIQKSGVFTVANSPRLTIDVQLSAQFLARVAPQKSETLVVPMKVALLALPPAVRADQISKISDASKLGGGVLTVNQFPFPVEATVTRLHP